MSGSHNSLLRRDRGGTGWVKTAPRRFVRPTGRATASWRAGSGVVAALVGLTLAAVVPPMALAALPGGAMPLAEPRTAVIFVTALILSPMLAAAAASLRGLDRLQTRLDRLPTAEHRPAVARIVVGALILLFEIGVAAAGREDQFAAAPGLVIAALGQAGAWLVLLQLILCPTASVLRCRLGLALDIALLSLLLHFGGATACVLLPLYPYTAISAGAYHGRTALIGAIALAATGFAAAAATTPFWQAQPLLGAGVAVALIVFPAYVSSLLGGLARSQRAAVDDNAAKGRFLAAVSEDLRDPLMMMLRSGAALDPAILPPAQRDLAAHTRRTARAMLAQIDELPELMEIEAGDLAPERRPFDLYRLVEAALAAARPQAADAGKALALRIDVNLPYRVIGWPQQLRQALVAMLTAALPHAAEGARLRLAVELIALRGDDMTIGMTVSDKSSREPNDAVSEHPNEMGRKPQRLPGLAAAERLVAIMGGGLGGFVTAARQGVRVTAELPLGLDHAALGLPIDLAGQPVWIVTRDRHFAEELVEPLEAWRGRPQWIGAAEAALAHLDAADPDAFEPWLIVDGRSDALQALGWVDRAIAAAPQRAGAIVFAVDEERIDSLLALSDADFGAVLPAPFSAAALQNALHALPPDRRDKVAAGGETAAAAAPARPSDENVAGVSAEPAPPPHEPVLPVAPEPRPQTAAPPRRNILQVAVVAENPANRRIIARMVAVAKHIAVAVAGSDDVLDVLATREIDVVLLDLNRPAVEDYRAVREWRRLRPDLAVVALVGDGDAAIERQCRQSGIGEVLAKPVGPGRMLAAIEAAIRGDTAGRQTAAASVAELAPRRRGEAAALAGLRR